MDDYYQTLGVSHEAKASQIHAAYRTAAKKFHPDRNAEHAEGGSFRAIQEAYETLGDEQRKREYDLRLRSLSGQERQPSRARYSGRPPVWPTDEEEGFDAPRAFRGRPAADFDSEVERFMIARLRRFEELLRRRFGFWE